MPLPKTRDVGKIMRRLKAENKNRKKPRSRAQMQAIALDVARRAGANISKKTDFRRKARG